VEDGSGQVIIDGFMFYNEVELLHMRLEELYPVVDRFVLVQAHHTFRGVYKETTFKQYDPQWEPYIDKIEMVNVGLSGGAGPWERETYQRNVISTLAKDLYAPDDILIISDVDEIPRREVVAQAETLVANGPVALEMKLYYYALNLYKGGWGAVKMLRVSDLTTAHEIRHAGFPAVEDGGWHFSYLGDESFISNKIKSFSHLELDTPEVHAKIAENRKNLLDPYNHGEKLVIENPKFWPHAVQNNPEQWSKYIWQE
jgi:beta-1,4-mannosyl-glycoprotein beta-1,4-N-acetylglucosaminyltransferase